MRSKVTVVGAGNVGARGRCQLFKKAALSAHLAAVQQNIAALAQGRADLVQQRLVGGDARGIQPGAAELDFAAVAVT